MYNFPYVDALKSTGRSGVFGLRRLVGRRLVTVPAAPKNIARHAGADPNDVSDLIDKGPLFAWTRWAWPVQGVGSDLCVLYQR